MYTRSPESGVRGCARQVQSPVLSSAESGVRGCTRQVRSPVLQSPKSEVRRCRREVRMYLSATILNCVFGAKSLYPPKAQWRENYTWYHGQKQLAHNNICTCWLRKHKKAIKGLGKFMVYNNIIPEDYV